MKVMFKSVSAKELGEEPIINDRTVKAVIGRVDVVDYENEVIKSESFKVDRLKMSAWNHNSMELSYFMGMTPEIVPPVGYGTGRVDGDKIIGEVEVIKTRAGDDVLELIKAARDDMGYSHGFSYEEEKERDDKVVELIGAKTFEMSPVPTPASPGTGTIFPEEMKMRFDSKTGLISMKYPQLEKMDELITVVKQLIEVKTPAEEIEQEIQEEQVEFKLLDQSPELMEELKRFIQMTLKEPAKIQLEMIEEESDEESEDDSKSKDEEEAEEAAEKERAKQEEERKRIADESRSKLRLLQSMRF